MVDAIKKIVALQRCLACHGDVGNFQPCNWASISTFEDPYPASVGLCRQNGCYFQYDTNANCIYSINSCPYEFIWIFVCVHMHICIHLHAYIVVIHRHATIRTCMLPSIVSTLFTHTYTQTHTHNHRTLWHTDYTHAHTHLSLSLSCTHNQTHTRTLTVIHSLSHTH